MYFVPVGLWITAIFANVRVTIGELIGMRIRKVPPSIIVNSLITATKAAGNSVVAVGTTSLRTLESAAAIHGLNNDNSNNTSALAGGGETNIFITPGFQFKIVDKLITNFHLPKSTLLMLVSAFAGFEPIKNAYAHAVKQEYRFFSYGDAMFLDRS